VIVVKRKILSFVVAPGIAIALGLLFALLPPQSQTARADGITGTEGVLTYKVNDDGITVKIIACETGDHVTDADVAAAFTSISALSYTITSIGKDAFTGVSYTSSITFFDPYPTDPEKIDPTKNRRNLKNIVLPDSVTVIDGGSVSVGASSLIRQGYDGAFSYSQLENITLPQGLTEIGGFAFGYCQGLKTCNISGSAISDSALTTIGAGAFNECSELTTFSLPPNLTTIEGFAFDGCSSLNGITLPASLAPVGNFAFSDCESLSSINIPAAWTAIPRGMLAGCKNITNVSIPDTVNLISRDAFANTGLTSVTIPAAVTALDAYVFENCAALGHVYFSDGTAVRDIYSGAFAGCTALTEIEIPDTVTRLSSYAFRGCTSLASVTFEEGSQLPEIGGYAFEGCVLLDGIEIPETVSVIGSYAFQNCMSLSEIKIPNAVTTLNSPGVTTSSAFSGCTNLERVILEADSELTGIGQRAFENCDKLTEIFIPNTVAAIEDYAFTGCTSLESVTFEAGSTLNTIGEGAFKGCTSLEEIELPDSLMLTEDETNTRIEAIGVSAFEGCTSLDKINIPDSVDFIPASVFSGCSNLSEVSISEDSSLSKIDADVFKNCNNLMSIFLPPSVGGIFPTAFSADAWIDETGATRVTLPVTIGAFYDSYALWWAKQNGYSYYVAPSRGEMRANPPGLMYKYIPYEFIAKTRVPNNEGLYFELDRQLPEGLTLYDGITLPADAPEGILPGTIYGSPLDYEDFESPVIFTMTAKNIGADGAVAEDGFKADATFTITLADTPNNAALETANAANSYPITPEPQPNPYPESDGDGHIGWLYEDGEYKIIARYDAVGNQIMYIENGPFDLFDSFWIDGVKQVRGVPGVPPATWQYTAEDGSTRVTVLKQTIQSLSDGEHTAAAVFRKSSAAGDPNDIYYNWNTAVENETGFESNLVVVAQKFTVELADRPTGGGNTDNGSTPDNGGAPSDGNTPNNGNTNAGDNQNNENAPGVNNANNAGNVNNPASGGAPGGTGADGTNPGGGAAGADDGAAEAAGDAAQTAEALAGDAPAGETADAATDEEAGGTGAVSGLPTDGNGRFYFTLDGSGAPLELRIDIPLAEYENLYFDGALWFRGGDYAVREGSTILTVTAERLERCEAGLHTLSARFESETVDIVFELIKTAANGTGPAASATGEANAASGTDAANAANTTPPFIPIIVTIIILAALCALYAVFRHRREA
jgi:hypothetical protein